MQGTHTPPQDNNTLGAGTRHSASSEGGPRTAVDGGGEEVGDEEGQAHSHTPHKKVDESYSPKASDSHG